MAEPRVATDRVEVVLVPGKGRGVRARCPIAKGTTIFVEPVLVIDAGDVPLIEKTRLGNWVCYWDGAAGCLPLGWIMLINHSSRPDQRNVTTRRDLEARIFYVDALRDIAAGEELLLDYDLPDDELERVYGIPRGS